MVLPCQLAMAHACRKWQDHGISLNWTGRSEDTEGTGVRVGVWMRPRGILINFDQAVNRNLQSPVLERLSNPPEEVQSIRAVK